MISAGQFEAVLVTGTLIRTAYYAVVYWAIYKEIVKNEAADRKLA